MKFWQLKKGDVFVQRGRRFMKTREVMHWHHVPGTDPHDEDEGAFEVAFNTVSLSTGNLVLVKSDAKVLYVGKGA